jgi:hypothetical protein
LFDLIAWELQSLNLRRSANTLLDHATNALTLEAGVWIVSELVRFDSYGIAPGALMHQARTLGSAPIGPKHLPVFSAPWPTGGLAVFHIRLVPIRGATKTAVLQVNCVLRDVPRERQVQGIRLSFQSIGSEFSGEVSGCVKFLSMPPKSTRLSTRRSKNQRRTLQHRRVVWDKSP